MPSGVFYFQIENITVCHRIKGPCDKIAGSNFGQPKAARRASAWMARVRVGHLEDSSQSIDDLPRQQRYTPRRPAVNTSAHISKIKKAILSMICYTLLKLI